MPRHERRDHPWHDGGVRVPGITGPQLKAARRLAKKTQKQLADLLDHKERTIQTWERDGVHPAKVELVRSRLGNFLVSESGQQPLAAYSDWALVSEIMARLESRAAKLADTNDEPDDTHKGGRGAKDMDDEPSEEEDDAEDDEDEDPEV